ncbi:MAG: hypothetical protein MR608_05485 [Clostridiales bacterium]|nr:hypothetical protein [Clostridiales bacterium]
MGYGIFIENMLQAAG